MTDHGMDVAYWNQMYSTACDEARRLDSPFFRLQKSVKVFIDGDKWCALFGENLQDGVAGFGDSPADAAVDFDVNWFRKIPPRNADVK